MNSWILDTVLEESRAAVRRTRESLIASRSEIREMRETLANAKNSIQRTQERILRTDRTLRAWGPLCSRRF